MAQTRTLFAAVVAVLGFAGAAKAQVLSLDKGYKAGPPPTIRPNGTWSVPANQATATWKIVCELGRFDNGVFVAESTLADAKATAAPNGKTGIWTCNVDTDISNIQPGRYVRAQLKKMKPKATPTSPEEYEVTATSTTPVSAPPPGGG